MGTTVPVVIIVIGVLLAGLAFFVWNRRKELKLERIGTTRKRIFFAQFIGGIAVALVGAAFMFNGDIFGENTSGIATIIGIVGISLIASSNVHLLPSRRK